MFYMMFTDWIKWTDYVGSQTDNIRVRALVQCPDNIVKFILEEEGFFEYE